MKRNCGDIKYMPGRSSAGLKLILKVGNSSSSTQEYSNFDSLVYTSNEGDERYEKSESCLSPVTYHSPSKSHKKSKKKKKKKTKHHDKHDKKKRHKKDKKKHYTDIQHQDEIDYSELSSHKNTDDDSTADGLPSTVMNTNIGFNSMQISIKNNIQRTSHKDDKYESKISPQLPKEDETHLRKLLEYLHQLIEARDTQNFFAWPVTEQIAPGYSRVICQPMDLNTMSRKISRCLYKSLPDYIDDFNLMCKNAMVYNHPETVYYKAAKKLLHFGAKLMSSEKLRSMDSVLPSINELSFNQLGFYLNPSEAPIYEEKYDPNTTPSYEVDGQDADSVKFEMSHVKDEIMLEEDEELEQEIVKDEDPDEIYGEDILAQVQEASKKLALNPAYRKNKLGFLRQSNDGSTTLAIIIPGEGIDQVTKERPISLGSFIGGKLSHGTSTWQAFKEDRRNIAKPVKPLNYGTFGSYAPSYDSTFANLTKAETDLLFHTYGDESAVQYAESVLNFGKDSDYTTVMVDNLLDIMTGGEHRKTKKVLEEKKKLKQEQKLQNNTDTSANQSNVLPSSVTMNNDDEKPELGCLKTLSELGIDTSFVDYYEELWKEEHNIKTKLGHTKTLLERLHQVQNDRLSVPLPAQRNLAAITETENQLAEKVTENLKNIIKKVSPCVVVPISGIRKAIGVSSAYIPEPSINTCFQQVNSSVQESAIIEGNKSATTACVPNTTCVQGIDLESELREFLENDTELSNFELPDDDDKTIEQMLSESS